MSKKRVIRFAYGSMMAHRVNDSDYLNINLQVCHPSEATFDGDEMGILFPESIVEDYEIFSSSLIVDHNNK